MRGGKYLAEERGSLDIEPAASLPIEAPVKRAVAPLFEIAATHDGQPALDWLRMFMQAWERKLLR